MCIKIVLCLVGLLVLVYGIDSEKIDGRTKYEVYNIEKEHFEELGEKPKKYTDNELRAHLLKKFKKNISPLPQETPGVLEFWVKFGTEFKFESEILRLNLEYDFDYDYAEPNYTDYEYK